MNTRNKGLTFGLTIAMALVIIATTVPIVLAAPVVTDPSATPDTIVADGVKTSRLNVTVTGDTARVDTVNVSLSQIGGSPAQGMEHLGNGVYSVTTNASVGTPPGTYNLPVNATDILGYSNTSVSIPLTVTPAKPDLIVTKIKPNCRYLFANESNNISAKIENVGGEDAGAFNVSFRIDAFSEEVRISELAAGANITVSITDTTLRTLGESVTINVTADCGGEVTEQDETNNAKSIDKTVVNNGYKGKRYTGGEDITTWQFHDQAHVNLTYSTGDSKYQGGYKNLWTTYTANWTASDLPIPSGATIQKAVLYAYYTFERTPAGNVTDYFTLQFNGNVVPIDQHYTDRKGHGSYNYPYGMVRYNVADDFIAGGSNNAELNNAEPTTPHHASLSGMMLMVVYEHADEPIRMIWLNEGFDIISARTTYCVTPEEATAYVPFTGGTIATDTVGKATLVTVMQDAFDGDDKNRLYFNGGAWHGIWNTAAKQGDTAIAINETDVRAYLEATDNEARLQSHIPAGATKGDGMGAANAILVVEYVEIPPSVSISTDNTTYYPGDTMFVTLNLTNPMDTDQDVQFVWWFGIPEFNNWIYIANMPLYLPAESDESQDIPIDIGYWGAIDFGAVWLVELRDLITFETISSDTAEWSYAPSAVSVGVREGEKTAVNIAEEMSEEINKTFKIEVEVKEVVAVAGLPA
jgi:hypothetical protein